MSNDDEIFRIIDSVRNKAMVLKDQVSWLTYENKKLKSELYEKDAMRELQDTVDRVKDNLRRGFPISATEEEEINQWKSFHKIKPCGEFTYTFIPDARNTYKGIITCSCGEQFTFCGERYHE